MHTDAVAARRQLLAIFYAALAAVDGGRLVEHALRRAPPLGGVHVVAIGKAAASMFGGARRQLGTRLRRGLIITKDGHAPAHCPADLECIASGHPLPDARSLHAGQALLAFIDATPPDGELLFLISGGTSALVEVLPAAMTVTDLVQLNRWLLGSGLDIVQVNQVRRALSCIKGGRLLGRLGSHAARCLLLSDVIGDDPANIGSGLLVTPTPAPATSLQKLLPAALARLAEYESPPPDPTPAPIPVQVLAGLADALAAAAQAGRAAGLAVTLHQRPLQGDAATTGRRLARALRDALPGLQVWGGETVVSLPPRPGRGGRSQQLALAAAVELAGQAGCYLLAAGTDGTDGPTPDAGALVDGDTLARGSLHEQDAAACLAAADAGHFLEASGDLLQTGPTGTNVMDIVLGLKL